MFDLKLTRRQFLAATAAAGGAASSLQLLAGRAVATTETSAYTASSITQTGQPASETSAYAAAVLAKQPVGYWRLGESSGPTVADSSGHGHDGVVHATARLGERGALVSDADAAIKLDGKRSYIEIPDDPAFSQPTSGQGLSVEVWMRPDTLTFKGQTSEHYVHWLGKGEPGGYEWTFRFYSKNSKRPNRISAYMFSPDGGLGAGAFVEEPLAVGEWMHLVACFDPGDASSPGHPGAHLYKNGRAVADSSGARYNTRLWQIAPAHTAAPVRLGTRDLGSFLQGALDEVAIYPRVLSVDEVAANYRASGRGTA